MHNRPLFILNISLLIGIAVVHAFALAGDLYWYYPLLNRAVHFSGGVWVALSAVWLLARTGLPIRFSRVILIVCIVSVMWEIFEVVIGMTHEANYVLDTSLDLAMDFCGGIIGFVLARRMVQLILNEDVESDPSEPR